MIGFRNGFLKKLIARADRARDEERFEVAAALYDEALRLAPRRIGLLIQRAHMLKEMGRLTAAGQHYEEARRLQPENADLALQIGHFYKVSGRLHDAHQAYGQAAELRPDWAVALEEQQNTAALLRESGLPLPAEAQDSDAPSTLEHAATVARLVPALAPKELPDRLQDYHPGIHVRRFGRHEHSFWKNSRTLRGVEAVRGFCISSRPIVEVQILLNGLAVYRGRPTGGFLLPNDRSPGQLLKYVFNVWLDFDQFARGRHKAEVRCIDTEAEVHAFHDYVVVGEPFSLEEHAGSDALIPLTNPDPVALEAAIRALPSEVRPARRTVLPRPPQTVMVMRTDQLGDVISSMAALRRLREILPSARIVGLLTTANADLARTLDLFDEVIVIDFHDDPIERRRLMSLPAQELLRQRLEPYKFDVAIDLSQSDVSRPLLLLSGAPFLYGVGGGDWPWLTAEFGLNTHDSLNRLDRVPHSAKTLALIETFGALVRQTFRTERRADLQRSRLERFGLVADAPYVVLHMGARIAFSRWPHFRELASRVLGEGGYDVVMMTEDSGVRATLPAVLRDDPRFHLIDERLEFDDFDAFVSFANVLVGNDSGPKHLASLRGVHVVTLFTARINWMEWAQEEIGTVISRRVPCAGCAIFHDPEECGKDFSCVRDIAVDEVFAAMKLSSAPPSQELAQ